MYIYMILIMGAGFLVQMMLKSKMNKYSQIPNALGRSGKEIAEMMLKDNGIYDVQVISTPGQLTDHYDPRNKTVNLSELVYASDSVTAAAVSAHECGHAVQHATAYSMLGFRSQMAHVLGFTNQWMSLIVLAGFFLMNITPIPLIIGVLLYGLTTVFSIITLPVEFDASARALKWLDTKGMQGENYDMAKDGLKWAAMTYVVNAIASIAQLLYYLSMFTGRRSED